MTTNHPSKNWINLAQASFGASVIEATDEFFGAKENLLNDSDPVFIPGKFTDQGKWMDGWESRRKRHEGYDYCVVKLGVPGIIRHIDIDTRHFTGNFPPSASIDACFSESPPDETTSWVRILPSKSLQADSHNRFDIDSSFQWNYVRLNIYPDGGVARLRVYGEFLPDWDHHHPEDVIDLISLKNGGRALICNDEHFGAVQNVITPYPPRNMGDGWETRRRREPGYDWAIFSLGRLGRVEKIVIETHFFKGNYPESCSIQGSYVKGGSEDTLATQSLFWPHLLTKSQLKPDETHTYISEINDIGDISHIRLNIFPDGGISRLYIYGKTTD